MSVADQVPIPSGEYGFVPDGSRTGEGFRPSDLLSLGLLLSYIAIANIAGRLLIPRPKTAAQKSGRRIYIWHIFDACIHFIHEGIFLYHCFFVYGPVLPESITTAGPAGKTEPRFVGGHHWTTPGVYFLNKPDRVYGPHRGNSMFARMWMDYAKADWRWAGTDLSVISVESFMLFVVGPMGIWVAEKIRRNGGIISKKAAFWMAVIAAFETFGNWAIIIPEIVTGFPNLNLHDGEAFWIHLVFMNSIWIFVPLSIIYRAYSILTSSQSPSESRMATTAAAAIAGANGVGKKNI